MSTLQITDIESLLSLAVIELQISGDDKTQVSPWIVKVSPFVYGYAERDNSIQDVRRMAQAWAGYYDLHDDLPNLAVLTALAAVAFTEDAPEPEPEPVECRAFALHRTYRNGLETVLYGHDYREAA